MYKNASQQQSHGKLMRSNSSKATIPDVVSADAIKIMPHSVATPSLITKFEPTATSLVDAANSMDSHRSRFSRFLGTEVVPVQQLPTPNPSPIQLLAVAQKTIPAPPTKASRPKLPKSPASTIPPPLSPPSINRLPSSAPLVVSEVAVSTQIKEGPSNVKLPVRRGREAEAKAEINGLSPDRRAGSLNPGGSLNRARSMSPGRARNSYSSFSPRASSNSPTLSPRVGTITSGRSHHESISSLLKQQHHILEQQRIELDARRNSAAAILSEVQKRNKGEVQQEQSELNEEAEKAHNVLNEFCRTPPALLRAIAATHEAYNHLSLRRLKTSGVLVASYIVSVVVGVGVGYYLAKFS
jgi:hypothetical protein